MTAIPSTDDVRKDYALMEGGMLYASIENRRGEEFDAWLAEQKAAALEDAADRVTGILDQDNLAAAQRYLRWRASAIKKQELPDERPATPDEPLVYACAKCGSAAAEAANPTGLELCSFHAEQATL